MDKVGRLGRVRGWVRARRPAGQGKAVQVQVQAEEVLILTW